MNVKKLKCACFTFCIYIRIGGIFKGWCLGPRGISSCGMTHLSSIFAVATSLYGTAGTGRPALAGPAGPPVTRFRVPFSLPAGPECGGSRGPRLERGTANRDRRLHLGLHPSLPGRAARPHRPAARPRVAPPRTPPHPAVDAPPRTDALGGAPPTLAANRFPGRR